MEVLKLVLIGMIFGVANIIPGVSGGTMAVIFNIYDRLIETLSLKNFKKNLPFLICIAVGAGSGIIAFSNIVGYLLENFPVATNFAFLGLIVGSIPSIYKKVAYSNGQKNKIKISYVLTFMIGIAIMVALKKVEDAGVTGVTFNADGSIGAYLYLFIIGLVAMFAMLLPGISGSLVLLVLGGYETVMNGVKDFNFAILIPFGLGCLATVLGGSRVIGYLMKNKKEITYSFILGLIVASIYSIMPSFSGASVWEIIISIILLVTLTFVAYWFSVNSGEKE